MPDRFDAAALAMGGGPLDGVRRRREARRCPSTRRARLVGSYQWVERRLFEILGSWVASEPVPEAQMVFDVFSQQHAWHAELFADRLPALDSVDADALMVAPSPEVDRMLAVLAGAGPDGDRDADGSARGARGHPRHARRGARCRVWSVSAGWSWPGWSRGTPCISDGPRRSPTRP